MPQQREYASQLRQNTGKSTFYIPVFLSELKVGDKIFIPGSKAKWTVTGVNDKSVSCSNGKRRAKVIAKVIDKIVALS